MPTPPLTFRRRINLWVVLVLMGSLGALCAAILLALAGGPREARLVLAAAVALAVLVCAVALPGRYPVAHLPEAGPAALLAVLPDRTGIAVTWNTPDIQLELPDEADPTLFHPVPSHSLAPDTEYRIVARIWNGSQTAPAVGVPVRFSYLTFGIGTVSTPIGETTVDLPVKGAEGLPALALMKWRTPAGPGYYCIQVEPHWFDDANPANNLGQENVDVKPLNSPRAKFTFPVRNDGDFARELRLEVDAYAIPPLRPCERGEMAHWHEMDRQEIGASYRWLLAHQAGSGTRSPKAGRWPCSRTGCGWVRERSGWSRWTSRRRTASSGRRP